MEVLGVLAATGVDGSDFVLVLMLVEDVHATSIRWYYITTDLCVASSTILELLYPEVASFVFAFEAV